MTVRTWVTISVLVLVALTIAFAVRVFSPLDAPEIIASSSGERLEGVHLGSCWPQRDEELRCIDGSDPPDPGGPTLPTDGSLRIVVDFPVQPSDGTVRIRVHETEEVVEHADFDDRVDYELEPGDYLLVVEASYPEEAYVRYAFPFRASDDAPS